MSTNKPRRPAKIKKVAHVAIYVRDVRASAAWYQSLLEVRVTASPEIGVFLSFGDQHHDIALIQAPENSEQGQLGLQHVGLQIEGGIEELERLYGILLENNVDIHRIVDHGIGKGIYFHDPDGNRLEFFMEEVDGAEGIALFGKLNAPSDLIELTPRFEDD